MNTQLKSIFARRLAKKGKKPNGFTLIELMVVVGIVGTLTAVGLPELSKAQNKGKDAAAQSILSNAAKECSLNLITDTATVATANHTAAIASGGKFEGVAGDPCTLKSDGTNIVMTLLSKNAANTASVTFDGTVPGPVTIGATVS